MTEPTHPQPACPRLIGITPPDVRPWPLLEPACRAALAAGLPALMVRDKITPDAALEPLVRRLAEAAHAAGSLLLVNRRIELARAVGADGVHLGAAGPTLEEARGLLGAGAILGYSAHTMDEALDAFARGADYVTFSPIYATPSKQGILAPTGLGPLAALCRRAPGPVLALGGIGLEQIAAVRAAGAHGVAMIRAVLGEDVDPAQSVRALLAALAHLGPNG